MKLSVKSERINRLKSLCLLVVAWFLNIQAVHKRLIFIQRIRTVIINKKKMYLDYFSFNTLLLRGSSSE